MGKQAPGEFSYRVVTTVAVTRSIRELWLAPTGAPMAYAPGQYVLLGDRDHRLPQRSYSVASAPRADGQFSLLVTRYPDGPVSGWVHTTLRPGDVISIGGPYGNFIADAAASDPILLLGAGSGLAPVRALAEALLAANADREVILFDSARTANDAIDRARFEGWARQFPRFRYLLTLTRDPGAPLHGHVQDLLVDTVGALARFHVYVSGPSGFVTGCARAARTLGAPADRIHTEEFFADPEPWSGVPPPAPHTDARA